MLRPALAAATLLALAACSTKHVSLSGEAKFAATAEENYQAGLELYEDESYADAQKFFEYVRTKYPFSKYAALADLRIADMKFDQDQWAEAVEAYSQFVQLHPTHEEVDYAELRVGEAHLEDAPGDFALFPPSHEKDQRQVERAAAALATFVEKHPDSKYLPRAKELLAKARGRLAEHEWYVAEYYFKRKRWAGAAGRYETLVERYPGSKHEVEALMKLARAAVHLDERHRARTALQKLIVKHPEDPRRAEAEKLLASLRTGESAAAP
jgi:outer membrane protein assembly factor BamD